MNAFQVSGVSLPGRRYAPRMTSIMPAPSTASTRHIAAAGVCVNGHTAITATLPPSSTPRPKPQRHSPRAASTASTAQVPASCSPARQSAAHGGCCAAWATSSTLYSTVQISQAAGSGWLVRRHASRR